MSNNYFAVHNTTNHTPCNTQQKLTQHCKSTTLLIFFLIQLPQQIEHKSNITQLPHLVYD